MKTTVKKILVSSLLIAATSLCLSSAQALLANADDTPLSTVAITVGEPVAGESANAGLFYTSEEFSASIGWSTTADGSEANDFNFQPFEEGQTYYADFYLSAENGYEFSENATVLINGTEYTAEWLMGASLPKYIAVYDVPFTLAKTETPLVYVSGIAVTESNISDVLNDGTVSFDAETNTLTLNNATLTGGYETDGQFIAIYSAAKQLTVNLIGKNTIDHSAQNGEAMFIGISGQNVTVRGGELNFKTDFSILASEDVRMENVTGGIKAAATSQGAYGIQSEMNVDLMNCEFTFDLSSTSDDVAVIGLAAFQNVTINNSNLAFEISGTGEQQVGIMAVQECEVLDSTIEIKGFGTSMLGIYAFSNTSIENSDVHVEISATSENNTCIGLASDSGKITIKGGNVDVTAVGVAGNPSVFAVYTGGLFGLDLVNGASVKLRANSVLAKAPNLSEYLKEYLITASTFIDGTSPVEYDESAVNTYQYLYIRNETENQPSAPDTPPTTPDTPPTPDTPKKSSGCGSVIGGSISALSVAGLASLLCIQKRKREE